MPDFENLCHFFSDRDRFAKHCGIEIVSVGAGTAEVKMEIKPFHLNGADVVHGGALYTLADFAFALASNTRGSLSLGINTSMSFVKGASEGTLTARAREIADGPKLASYTVDVFDAAGELIAVFQGMVYRKKQQLPF